MSKICRTCLKKSKLTFKSTQSLGDFGDGAVRISVVLRFCIPELYLGLSTNPVICYECKEQLKVSYLFKKNCLNTEKLVGTFLKNVRCTAKGVELDDVLVYLDNLQKEQSEAKKVNENISHNAQAILSEWTDEQVDSDTFNSERDGALEVRQSAPNPTNSKGTGEQLRFCEQTGFFFNKQGESFDFAGNSIQKKQNQPSIIVDHQTEKSQEEIEEITNTEINPIENTETGTGVLFKIANVFSLSEESTENPNDSHDLIKSVDHVSDSNYEGEVRDSNESVAPAEIKSEPLDGDINDERFDFNYVPTDEETLDASETASYENLRCDSSLQGIIDNIPEINDDMQYVDIPEFVQINNFGLKELEELRQQHMKATNSQSEEKATILNFSNKLQFRKISEPYNLSKVDANPVVNGTKMVKSSEGDRMAEESMLKSALASTDVTAKTTIGTHESPNYIKAVTLDEDTFNKIPEVIFIGGKKYIKSVENKGFKIAPGQKEGVESVQNKLPQFKQGIPIQAGGVQDSQKNITLSALLQAGDVVENLLTKADSRKAKSTPTFTITGPPKARRRRKLKIVPVNDKNPLPPQKRTKPVSKMDDRDIVVLFTNYTMDAVYINDHDYLVNPYKRNKVLLEEGDEWICMCYICHTKHYIHHHIAHMTKHGTLCKICRMDLGTPYMLNVHVRAHSKPCGICTERVPYGLLATHEQKHFKVEPDKQNKNSNRRRRANKDEKPVTPVEFESEPEEVSDVEDVSYDESSQSEKKLKGRKRKNTSETSPTVEKSNRVLRSNVKKSYTESDDMEDVKSSNLLEQTWASTGPP